MATEQHFPPPFPWLNPNLTQHLVKNKRLSAILCNKSRDMNDIKWLEEQVEAHRVLLWGFVERITERKENGDTMCRCQTMSAGLYSWAWVDGNNKRRRPRALEYIALVNHWIEEKLRNGDTILKPQNGLSPLSQNQSSQALPCSDRAVEDGCKESRDSIDADFKQICRPIFIQMFRIYAHLYYDHFIEPFTHLDKINELNMSFSLFLTTATNLDMLKADDLGPMQALIDLWASKDVFESGSKIKDMANIYNPSFPAVI
ncbi:Mob1/phocein [Mariannaea sp. PMI_226]|nr:Mob1/phocein [Mariannaea sp. PMI_226]